MKTIDLTMTWKTALSIFLLVIENGNTESKKQALCELQKMAELADKYVLLINK